MSSSEDGADPPPDRPPPDCLGSALSLRSPLYIEGSFKKPDLRPDYTRIGLRAAAAAVLGGAAAPAALVATADLGQGKDATYWL